MMDEVVSLLRDLAMNMCACACVCALVWGATCHVLVMGSAAATCSNALTLTSTVELAWGGVPMDGLSPLLLQGNGGCAWV